MITESTREYKGYRIRLRAVTGNGFWYKIEKDCPNEASPNGIKNIILMDKGFDFIEPSVLYKKATDYIDNFSDRLEIKFNEKIKQLHERNNRK